MARSEFIFATPILPKIAVSAAKKAEPKAKICQEEKNDFMMPQTGVARSIRAGGTFFNALATANTGG